MHLFDPIKIREITYRNRIAVSPMCQYSSVDGYASDWHFVHLGSRAVGGAGLVMTEAAAVEARGRISPQDLGIWSDDHVENLARITKFIQVQGAVAGIQLAHAGRKASVYRPWDGGGTVPEDEGGWNEIIAPSAIPFSDGSLIPKALEIEEIQSLIQTFVDATHRAEAAGFQVVEIHAAHGYLLHEFLSPLTNQRTDDYGGSFLNRTRLLREVVQAVRQHLPERYPLFLRISATDWVEGGWDIEQSVELVGQLQPLGIDLVDCSSGAIIPKVSVPTGAGYQTPFSERIRRETGILTGAVGMITAPQQADHIIRTGQADMVLLGRELLRDPYWPLKASIELNQSGSWPPQYLRGKP
ncbi:MAG TPA: NADH:flavin oxidoreductase/NADH oxidase [Oculatellaceae cyanobacterium]|jgi:2,4-dienoyl-CoA reductase-like NADH-dependent reductase (Old Yellow Enzyme family)